MGNVRPELKKSQWRLDKHEFYMAYHFALNYLPWVMARNELLGLKSLDDMAGVVSSLPGDPVSSAAVRIATLSHHIGIIEDAAKEAAEKISGVICTHVIPRPEGDTEKMLKLNAFDKR